jgi:hypothetical protein
MPEQEFQVMAQFLRSTVLKNLEVHSGYYRCSSACLPGGSILGKEGNAAAYSRGG